MNGERLNIVLIAPNCDGTDVGEAFCAHRWVQHMSAVANVTLLTQTRRGRTPPSAQLPQATVVAWPELQLPRQFERLNRDDLNHGRRRRCPRRLRCRRRGLPGARHQRN